MNNSEKTLSIIKPDAVERNLENEIKEIFRNKIDRNILLILDLNILFLSPYS